VKFAIAAVATVSGFGEGGNFVNGLLGLTQMARAGLELLALIQEWFYN